jgi:DNA modification methylase
MSEQTSLTYAELKEYEIHEVANLFPMMREEEFDALCVDIQTNGLITPICLFENKIIDGRNRYKACRKIGINPQTVNWKGEEGNLVNFVISANLHRRHLSSGQRAVLALEFERYFAVEAEKRMKAGVKIEENPPAFLQEGSKGESAEQAAKVLKISQRYVHYAKKLEKDAPDLFEQVKKGEINLSQAKQLLKKRTLEAVKSERQKEVQTVEKRAFFYLQPAAEFLPRFEAESVDLLLTDPPYSTDVDDVPSFIRTWLPQALSKIKLTGRAFICIGAYPQEQSDYLIFLLNETDWTVDNPLIWTYRNTLGVTPKMKYNLNYQVILHLYRDSSNPLDTSITNEMFSVQDINAPDGRQNDRFHEWQKPDELAARLIRHATRTNDVIIDPFACTGTFLEAAAKLNRTAFGCDTNPASLDIIREYRCLIQL